LSEKSTKSPKLNQELELLQARVRNLSSITLDRDLAEVSLEVNFLEEQVRADFGSYSPVALLRAKEKISLFNQKAEILNIELRRRTSK